MKLLAFDSGVGGLSALAPLFRHYDALEVVYLGDLANLPYGTKSPARIRTLMERNTRHLLEREKAHGPFAGFLLACNTASAHAMDVVQLEARAQGIPALGVLEPSCAAALTRNAKRIVVLATPGTVASDSYAKALKAKGAKQEIIQIACPLFVPLVEDNLYSGPAVDLIIERYLKDKLRAGDCCILGCTHYPLLLPALKKQFPGVDWIMAGDALLETQAGPFTKSTETGKGLRRLRVLFTDSGWDKTRVENLLGELGVKNVELSVELIRVGP